MIVALSVLALTSGAVPEPLNQDAPVATDDRPFEERWEAIRAALASDDSGERQRAALEALGFLDELAAAGEDARARRFEVARALGSGGFERASIDERVGLLSRAAEDAPDLGERARCWFGAGSLLRGGGRYDDCIELLDHALATFDPAEDIGPHLVLLAADAAFMAGRTAEAHERLDALEALDLDPADRTIESVLIEAPSLRGVLDVRAGRFDTGLPRIVRAVEQAEALYEQNPYYANLLINLRLRLVEAYSGTLDLQRGIALVDGYLTDAGLYADRPEQQALLIVNSASRLEQLEALDPDRERRADAELARALELGLSVRTRSRLQLARARLALARGDTESAAAHLAEARATLEDFTLPTTDVRSLELATLSARHARLTDAPPATLAAHRATLRDVFAALLDDGGDVRPDASGTGHPVFRERRDLVNELARFELLLEGERDGARAALGLLDRLQSRGPLAARLGAEAADDALPPFKTGTGLLAFLPTVGGGSVVLAFDARGVSAGPVATWHVFEPARQEYAAHLASMRRILTAGGAPEQSVQRAIATERRLAAELARMLLPPPIAERMGRWSRVTVIGLEGVNHVPIAWLPVGDEPYLGQARDVTLLPSLPAARAIAASVGGRKHDGALVGGVTPCPDVSARWPSVGPLPLPPDVEGLLLAPYEKPATRTASEATAAEVAELCATGVGCLQFLVYGVYDHRRNRPAGLVLGGDRRCVLWPEDVEALTQRPRVVLLTACRSGVSPERRGDAHAADLAGAWLGRGTTDVLVSRGDLTWAEAVEIGAAMHAGLRAGRSPAAALRTWRAAVVEREGERAPFLAHGIELIGLGHEPVFR